MNPQYLLLLKLLHKLYFKPLRKSMQSLHRPVLAWRVEWPSKLESTPKIPTYVIVSVIDNILHRQFLTLSLWDQGWYFYSTASPHSKQWALLLHSSIPIIQAVFKKKNITTLYWNLNFIATKNNVRFPSFSSFTLW